MLPDARYVTVEDAAKQIKVQPITLRRWLGDRHDAASE